MAEVLITLGIIGIVAAMTLPMLIQNYQNKIVETRLAKFYSIFNQAIKLAEVEHGPQEYWWEDASGVELDEDGNPIESTANIDIWFKKYLNQFMLIKKTIKTDGEIIYYLNDGSAFQFGTNFAASSIHSARELRFYPGGYDRCKKAGFINGVCKFQFEWCPTCEGTYWKYHYKRGLEPAKFNWDGNPRTLYTDAQRGCKLPASEYGIGAYCTAIIQLNGWKIPKDYPYKVRP